MVEFEKNLSHNGNVKFSLYQRENKNYVKMKIFSENEKIFFDNLLTNIRINFVTFVFFKIQDYLKQRSPRHNLI